MKAASGSSTITDQILRHVKNAKTDKLKSTKLLFNKLRNPVVKDIESSCSESSEQFDWNEEEDLLLDIENLRSALTQEFGEEDLATNDSSDSNEIVKDELPCFRSTNRISQIDEMLRQLKNESEAITLHLGQFETTKTFLVEGDESVNILVRPYIYEYVHLRGVLLRWCCAEVKVEDSYLSCNIRVNQSVLEWQVVKMRHPNTFYIAIDQLTAVFCLENVALRLHFKSEEMQPLQFLMPSVRDRQNWVVGLGLFYMLH